MTKWVVPSGTTVSVELGSERPVPNRDAVSFPVVVESTGGARRDTEVVFTTPGLNNVLLEHSGEAPLDTRGREKIALLSVLRSVEEDEGFFVASESIVVDGAALSRLRETPSLSDQAIRRYIARKLYVLWSEEAFHGMLEFDEVDAALTGAGPIDFLRNVQVLAQEGYVRLEETMDAGFGGFWCSATARLIRDVERYGAARDDVETAEDYGRRLASTPAVSDHQELLLLQRQRLSVAATPAEIVSVFRAVMPTVEAVVRRLLAQSGDQRTHASLGPMIAAMKNRQIGRRGLWSQLAALNNFARDIDLHGEEMPLSVLRIASEVCFELIPQLGLLYPTGS